MFLADGLRSRTNKIAREEIPSGSAPANLEYAYQYVYGRRDA